MKLKRRFSPSLMMLCWTMLQTMVFPSAKQLVSRMSWLLPRFLQAEHCPDVQQYQWAWGLLQFCYLPVNNFQIISIKVLRQGFKKKFKKQWNFPLRYCAGWVDFPLRKKMIKMVHFIQKTQDLNFLLLGGSGQIFGLIVLFYIISMVISFNI